MASDDYLTPYETALAVVATGMKKSRLGFDSLVVNSFVGGLLFSTGGMLYVLAQGENPDLYAHNPGLVHLIQGLLYPIGLFYVAVLGMELFNANVLYFSAAVCRRAVSPLDLAISWLFSWWFNLVGNIFVCYIICHYSKVTQTPEYVTGSVEVVMAKVGYSFVQTLLKGCAGNFFVSLAIYLQLMCKPIHVRLIMMTLPIFSFVSMGFTHAIADQYLMIIGLINGAPVSVATVAWKVFLPGTIGNIIGGSFFGVVITWYCHLYSVERDQAKLSLPKYEMRDEQPDVNVDSRVVRQRKSMDEVMEDEEPPIDDSLSRYASKTSALSRYASNKSSRSMRSMRSPRNVFPVYGMGEPLKRESTIAGRRDDDPEGLFNLSEKDNESGSSGAEFVGDKLRRAIRRRSAVSKSDLESQNDPMQRRQSSASFRPVWKGNPSYSGSNLAANTSNSSKHDPHEPVHKLTIAEGMSTGNTTTPNDSSLEVKVYDPEGDLGEQRT